MLRDIVMTKLGHVITGHHIHKEPDPEPEYKHG